MIIKCSRKITFDAAHRIIGHDGKCKFLHGHRYVCEAFFSGNKLDDLGMLIDFGIIKKKLGAWIDENLDHNVILSQDDHELAGHIQKTLNQKPYMLKSNPTAENIALHLLHEVCPGLFYSTGVTCQTIRLHESDNTFVEVSI
jgi:6-pyruvoyltetrahydropterin/6-carboxytetrahydropterin synthase